MEILHATAVAVGERGLVILGASGSGKSSLALALIALGARLVSDDRLVATALADGRCQLSAPAQIAGQIEARGLGILSLPHGPAIAHAAVTLDRVETARLPEAHETVIAGLPLPLLHKLESPAFPAILHAYLSGDRIQP